MAAEHILTISEVTRYIKSLMEEDVVLQEVWLRGELSNVKLHSRGHLYFTVKDDKSRMQSVMFAGHNRYLSFKPENGMKVLLRGEVNVYEPYGQYQFYAKEMQPDGVGSLYLAYEALKAKLEEEGLFAAERKKAIPIHPARIAVVTSPTGAAIRDIVTTLKRRYPVAQITLLPVLVQGEQAPSSIIYAIKQAVAANCFDVMIVGRGGGSIEELWAFNDEGVARAIAASNIPVISAVGHETDYTISDFVADLRAPTPTGAAELAVPDQNEIVRTIMTLRKRLTLAMKEQITREGSKLERLKRSYAFKYPEQLVRQKEQELDGLLDRLKRVAKRALQDPANQLLHLEKSLKRLHPDIQVKQAQEKTSQLHVALVKAMKEQLNTKRQPFQKAVSELQLLSPLRLMERGYSLAYDKDQQMLIKSTKQVEVGSELQIRLKDGKLYCRVEEKQPFE
ncbi:exodeoxyribonuclease VII large subunit [Halalkalibacter nanhaiisediminis]|uniref:Exodeoxyribonuclease 7 large subunit n=1 Tax=Halalkalibacter nanhaiisediminis TaxID=688079 RepID=A0A562QGR2_9BACI|nr:exodeoxyribonuclease VII large subunit [Halalkalibacter nanhaiisediminis]TWI55947.1 exodeoxyribonuclease VII large subunit [Halalkalibacter nanhaiisediminis]